MDLAKINGPITQSPTSSWAFLDPSLPEVDPERTGVTGISGRLLTLHRRGVDSRFQTGRSGLWLWFLSDTLFESELQKPVRKQAARWMAWWDLTSTLEARKCLSLGDRKQRFRLYLNALRLSYLLRKDRARFVSGCA
jgi:hypothetical protein